MVAVAGVGFLESEALDQIGAAVTVIDPQTHIIEYANAMAAKLLQRPLDEIVGQPCFGTICASTPGQCPITAGGRASLDTERVSGQYEP